MKSRRGNKTDNHRTTGRREQSWLGEAEGQKGRRAEGQGMGCVCVLGEGLVHQCSQEELANLLGLSICHSSFLLSL